MKPKTASYAVDVTVLEVIQRSADFLSRKGVESPRLQAELLLAHVLGLQRMQLYLSFERVLSSSEEEALRQFVKRRGGREPLQHILGTACFCGLEMQVSRDVLVPRPETELLAEQGWTFLNQRVAGVGNPPDPGPETARSTSALDFGTGSGCLVIALAVKAPSAHLVALDISAAALSVAQANAVKNQVAERIHFVMGSELAVLPAGSTFDLIVANPPYIPTAEIPTLEPEVRDYDPTGALDGGPDGLRFYRMLASEAGTWLNAGGRIMMEFGDGQEEAIKALFENENWIVDEIIKDYTHTPRILVAHRKD